MRLLVVEDEPKLGALIVRALRAEGHAVDLCETGEDALWRYKRGATLAALGRSDAEADLRKALTLEGRKWVHARSHLELGKLALKAGNKAAAATEFRAAIPLADSDNDPLTSEEAHRLMK